MERLNFILLWKGPRIVKAILTEWELDVRYTRVIPALGRLEAREFKANIGYIMSVKAVWAI